MMQQKPIKRVFLIVLDSFGIGELPDAAQFSDEGSDTLGAVAGSVYFSVPEMRRLGLLNIEGISPKNPHPSPVGSYARMGERSAGKDTTTGHWEIAGLVSSTAMPTFPDGFPQEILDKFEKAAGRGVLCNRPYSGTKVLEDYGEEHLNSGKLIVYTSADSVFQIAAHEKTVPIEELYRICREAREILQGPYAVGRVIARPFDGEPGAFFRTPRRHDFSLIPPKDTMLDAVSAAGLDCIGVGKIYDIFAGKGVTETYPTVSNRDGMEKTDLLQKKEFHGLCFVNLVDFDMVYGHRNDVAGYARALSEFDSRLGAFLSGMAPDDVLFITADHGCDPATPSTDHSREYVPMLAYGKSIRSNRNLGTRCSFADLGATVLELLGVSGNISGNSFAREIRND